MDREMKRFLMVLFGGFLFALSLNLFIVPLNLYSCGVVGFAQLIRTLLIDYTSIDFLNHFDIAGCINMLINIPLFIIAFQSISRKFFFKTLCCVIVETIAMSFVPIPSSPILNDVLASCLVGGIIGGFGIGLTLRNGGSGGGIDILGVYFMKNGKVSVGLVSMIVNLILFSLCAILFDVQTAIYSILYTAVFSVALDKGHYQNINMTAMVFTKNLEVQDVIMKELGRGVTYWDGAGAYTKSDTRIFITVINKYEVNEVKKIIKQLDPHAFVIINEGINVYGNFEKRI